MAYQPKSYKKFVATAATATLVASAVVPVAFAAKPATEFSDVAPQYKDAVDYLVDNTIAAGKTPSTFGTAENIIRVDAAIWIAKATLTEGEISAAPASDFTDVPDRGVIYVDALKSKGYVNGTDATTYNSYANISRGEVAMILAEAYDITGNTANNKFTDVNSRYLAAVSALKDNEITSGKTSTRFGTNDAITRGELAIWVYKLENLGALTVSNLNVAVDGSKATVTADVKNVEENADATVSVYPNGNLSATPIVNSTKVVGGKVNTVFNDVPAGTHTVVVKVGEVESSKSFVIAAAATSKVESVTAIDATTVVVKVNTALSKSSAENEALYLVNGAAPSKATLSADGKTVTLTAAEFANPSQVTVWIDNVLQTAAGEDFAKVDYTTNFLFSDTVAPTVSAISTPNGSLRVAFSEKLDVPATDEFVIVVNGESVSVTPEMVVGNVVTLPKTTVDTFGLKAGSNYGIVIAGAQDLVDNEMAFYSGNFTYQVITDTTAPTVSEVTAEGESTINVKFSEEVKNPTVTVTRNGNPITVSPIATKDSVNYEYDLSPLYQSGATTESLQVTVSGAKDFGNNVIAPSTKTVTLTKDTAKPVLSKTSYNSTDELAVLEFNEDIKVATTTGTAEEVNTALASKIVVINNATSEVVPSSSLYYSVTDNSIEVSGLATGSYTFRVNAGTVSDDSLASNLNNAFTTTVAVAVTVEPTPVEVTADVTRDLVSVTFSEEVAGGTGANSATNLANYRIDGQALPSGSFATLSTDANGVSTAKITLPTGSFTTDRTGILTVSNVKTADGAAVPTANLIVDIEDTKTPVLSSAKVNGTSLVLTFSEDLEGAADATDFITKVNGVDVNETVTAGTTANQLIITTTDSVSFATGTITVEVAAGSDLTDTAEVANPIVKGTKVTATR